ncbi:restriction endonuclease subunit S [Metamycoplasma sualvi]|uniref:restriction endonuclease subunit S n=1 Tax=Metamycoplasma sualvi TaxID=2125 RepID=UPI003872E84E
MAIKEYKLQEIGKFQNYEIVFSKYHVSTDNMEAHKMPNFYPKSGNYFPKNSILMSNIRPYFNKVWYSDREGSKSPNVLCFIVENKNAMSKYIYYLIRGTKFNNFWSKTSKGTTMPVGDKNALLNYKFKLPNLEDQQEIINIIEPFERLKIYISNFIDKIEILFLKIGETSKILGKMKDFNIKFEKGMNINSKFISNQKSNILFINVSAINNKFNKWLINNDIKENVEYGDIILSLDGTIGIVNNFLKGFNGYGYKISSKNIDNSIIYCSLIDRRNKQIMIDNSTGSVIKHSLNSKNELVLLDIKKEEINKLFELQITYKKWLIYLNKIIKKLIEIYIY